MSTTATDDLLFACPDAGCLIFPYDQQSDIDEHIAAGEHVYAGSWVPSFAAIEKTRELNGSDEPGEGSSRSSAPDTSTVVWAKHDGAWALRGVGLVEGTEVTVTKRDGSTQQVTVGRLVEVALNGGFDLAYPAQTESIRWAKIGTGWALRIPTGAGEVGATVTVSKRDGSITEAVVGAEVGSGDGFTLHEATQPQPTVHAVSGGSLVPSAGKVYATAGGDIVRVQTSKTGRLYGKVWDAETETFEYCSGCLKMLDHELSAKEAAAFGHRTSLCVFCARSLTDDRSITVGYGPICAGKHGLPWGD